MWIHSVIRQYLFPTEPESMHLPLLSVPVYQINSPSFTNSYPSFQGCHRCTLQCNAQNLAGVEVVRILPRMACLGMGLSPLAQRSSVSWLCKPTRPSITTAASRPKRRAVAFASASERPQYVSGTGERVRIETVGSDRAIGLLSDVIIPSQSKSRLR
jgi:hypothetical protein